VHPVGTQFYKFEHPILTVSDQTP